MTFSRRWSQVENVWFHALQRAGLAPDVDADVLHGLVTKEDLAEIAARAEASGNPVVPLVAMMRERLAARDETAARWLHRGLTSQDVLDTALVLCARAAHGLVLADLERQVATLSDLAERHRDHLMAGRTLTQHAVPITFGLKAA